MKKIKKVSDDKVVNNWFDSENARLIILCAVLGIFGAHKFAQHKTSQGILFILLDLTIFGLIISLIWAFLDLVFLTAKPNNKSGNMILGSVFILVNLSASMFMGMTDSFLSHNNKKTLDLHEEFMFEKDMQCHISKGISPIYNLTVIANAQKVDLIVNNNIITVPVKTNAQHTSIYEGYWKYDMPFLHSTNPQDKFIVTVNKDTQRVQITGNLYGQFANYECE